MDETRALEFIKRIIEECFKYSDKEWAWDYERKKRAWAIISQLYELMQRQGADAETLELVKICSDELDEVLKTMRQYSALSRDSILEARVNARMRREEAARHYGRCG